LDPPRLSAAPPQEPWFSRLIFVFDSNSEGERLNPFGPRVLPITVWRGFPQAFAEERALRLASKEAPGSRAVVHESQLSGIEWKVRLWLFDASSRDPREAVAHVRATDGLPLGFETLA